jgi:hypothetical protein
MFTAYIYIYIYIYIYTTHYCGAAEGRRRCWTDYARNEVLLSVKEQRNILHEISKLKANWIGHMFRKNCPLRRAIEGKIKGGKKVTERRERRSRKLLYSFKEKRGYSSKGRSYRSH